MKTEKIEDKVVLNIPVYLAKSLLNQLYLLQYPSRPKDRSYDDECILKAQVKPVSGQIELEVALRTRTPCFDRRKGEEIAISVDGINQNAKTPEESHFSNNTMDKVTLTSTKCLLDQKSYALGVMTEGCFHISPLTSKLSLKPSFRYLDVAEKRRKSDSKDQDDDIESESEPKKLGVTFEKIETERSKEFRERSFAHQQKQLENEPWIPVSYHRFGSEKSRLESEHLYCSYPNEVVNQFILNSEQYLSHLIPPVVEAEAAKPGLPTNQISATTLKSLPLQERIKIVIQNAVVASFNELVCSTANKNKSEDLSSILKAIQQYAVLVQGNWVMKSELVYPKEGISESNVPNEVLQRTRDCILYQFLKNPVVSRSAINELINIPAQDLTKVLRGISKCKVGRGNWEFLLSADNNFIKKYPEVAQRQQMIWQSRYEQLSQHFIKKT